MFRYTFFRCRIITDDFGRILCDEKSRIKKSVLCQINQKRRIRLLNFEFSTQKILRRRKEIVFFFCLVRSVFTRARTLIKFSRKRGEVKDTICPDRHIILLYTHIHIQYGKKCTFSNQLRSIVGNFRIYSQIQMRKLLHVEEELQLLNDYIIFPNTICLFKSRCISIFSRYFIFRIDHF